MDEYEFKGTGAPWKVQEVTEDYFYERELNIKGSMDEHIVSIALPNEEETANAHLIAAAPEMLTLLIYFNEVLDVSNMDLKKNGAIHKKITTILNKALNIQE